METRSINETIKYMNSFIKDPIKIRQANSFDRLLNLQLLIHSYLGIKEFCKK